MCIDMYADVCVNNTQVRYDKYIKFFISSFCIFFIFYHSYFYFKILTFFFIYYFLNTLNDALYFSTCYSSFVLNLIIIINNNCFKSKFGGVIYYFRVHLSFYHLLPCFFVHLCLLCSLTSSSLLDLSLKLQKVDGVTTFYLFKLQD